MRRGVKAKRVYCDEIWSFTYAKHENVAGAKGAPGEPGATWTWTALDADSQFIASCLVGGRDSETAIAFMQDVAERVNDRIQCTTDCQKACHEAAEGAFGPDVDDVQLAKVYSGPTGAVGHERKYSTSECAGIKNLPVTGGAHQHLLRAAVEPYDAHADAMVHAPHQRLLKEGREACRTCSRFTQSGATACVSITR